MALGDFPYPTSNLALTYIAAGLYSGQEELEHCCLNQYVIPAGLSATYCPGADSFARMANLQADKQQSYFKAYNPPTPMFLSGGSYGHYENESDFINETFPLISPFTLDLDFFKGIYDGEYGEYFEYIKITDIVETEPDTCDFYLNGVAYNRNSSFPIYLYSSDGVNFNNNPFFRIIDIDDYLNWDRDVNNRAISKITLKCIYKFKGNPHEESTPHNTNLSINILIGS